MDAELLNAFNHNTYTLHLQFLKYKKTIEALQRELANSVNNYNKAKDSTNPLHKRNCSYDKINDMHIPPLRPSLTQANVFQLNLPTVPSPQADLLTDYYAYGNKRPTSMLSKGSNALQRSKYDESFELYKSRIFARNCRYIDSIQQQASSCNALPSVTQFTPAPISKGIKDKVVNHNQLRKQARIVKKKSIPVNPYRTRSTEIGQSDLLFNPLLIGFETYHYKMGKAQRRAYQR